MCANPPLILNRARGMTFTKVIGSLCHLNHRRPGIWNYALSKDEEVKPSHFNCTRDGLDTIYSTYKDGDKRLRGPHSHDQTFFPPSYGNHHLWLNISLKFCARSPGSISNVMQKKSWFRFLQRPPVSAPQWYKHSNREQEYGVPRLTIVRVNHVGKRWNVRSSL